MTVEEFIACPDRSSPVDFIENLHHDLRFVDVRITTPYYNLQIRPEFEVAQFLLLSALGRSIVLSKVVNGNLFRIPGIRSADQFTRDFRWSLSWHLAC